MASSNKQPAKPRRVKPWIWLLILAPFAIVTAVDVTSDLTTRAPLFSSQKPDHFGFTALRMIPKEADTGAVIIWAPENCPREAGQHATQLAEALQKDGIPFYRTNQLNYRSSMALGLVAFFVVGDLFKDMEQPIVIIDKQFIANPSVETVISKYRSLPKDRATSAKI